jgi:asparagine N-glycosylation enzyme membrane subunit Stt3
VRIKDSRVTQFLTTDGGEDTMVTKTFLASQIAQLLEAAARDASRYVAIGTVDNGTYQHELNMHQGDRLSCIVVVQAKSSTHGNEPYVNTQTWRVEFEQDSTLDHSALYNAGPPIITLIGAETIHLSQSKAANYIDNGATAVSSDGTENLTSSIITTGAIGTAPGFYTITYTVTDSFERSTVRVRNLQVS